MENSDKVREMLERLLGHECEHHCADEGTTCFYCGGRWDNCIADYHHHANCDYIQALNLMEETKP